MHPAEGKGFFCGLHLLNTGKRIPEECLRKVEVLDARGVSHETNIINLTGLNFLILGSSKPEADQFRTFAAEILTEFQTTGQVASRNSLDPNAHLERPVQKDVSKVVNGLAFGIGGREAAIAANIAISRAYNDGRTPKQM